MSIHRNKLPWLLNDKKKKKSDCQVEDVGSTPGSGRSPGEGMATHSSILACKIPWTEEPGRLQSMGSQKSQTWLSKATKWIQTVKCIHTVKPIASIWCEAVLQMQMSIYPHSDQDIEYFQHCRACIPCNPSQTILHPKKYPLFWLLAPSVGFTCSWVT